MVNVGGARFGMIDGTAAVAVGENTTFSISRYIFLSACFVSGTNLNIRLSDFRAEQQSMVLRCVSSMVCIVPASVLSPKNWGPPPVNDVPCKWCLGCIWPCPTPKKKGAVLSQSVMGGALRWGRSHTTSFLAGASVMFISWIKLKPDSLPDCALTNPSRTAYEFLGRESRFVVLNWIMWFSAVVIKFRFLKRYQSERRLDNTRVI